MKTNTKIVNRKMDPANLIEILNEHPFVVLYVGPDSIPAWGVLAILDDKLKHAHVGWIDPRTVNSGSELQSLWIHLQRERLGWPSSTEVPNGYYLFVNGDVVSYEPGAIDYERDRISIAMAFGITALSMLFEPESVPHAMALTHAEAGHRVARSFATILEEKSTALARAFLVARRAKAHRNV